MTHPQAPVFATVGDDKFLRIYVYESIINHNKNCLLNLIELQSPARSCDFSPNGKYLVVGYDNGVFEMFNVYFDSKTEFF